MACPQLLNGSHQTASETKSILGSQTMRTLCTEFPSTGLFWALSIHLFISWEQRLGSGQKQPDASSGDELCKLGWEQNAGSESKSNGNLCEDLSGFCRETQDSSCSEYSGLKAHRPELQSGFYRLVSCFPSSSVSA